MIKKVYISGSQGMVGSNIIDMAPDHYELISPKLNELNLLNFAAVDNFISSMKPDIIIHTAGIVGGIQSNIANPVKYLVDNTEMGKNLLLAAKKNSVLKIINLGSSCMYPKDAANPLKEDLILKGELEPTNEGYAIAKVYTQRLSSYIKREDNNFDYKTIVPCNLYGKWDKFDPKHSHMLPAVIRKIHNAKVENLSEVEIWGDGEARREFMFASDLADFIWYAVDNFNKMPDLMNVGLGSDHTINEYYQAIAKVIGFKGKFVHDLTKPVGMKQKLVDINRLKAFGWEHKHSLEQGIKKTYEFFVENHIGSKN
jgi:GDP-L-fucose synthase